MTDLPERTKKNALSLGFREFIFSLGFLMLSGITGCAGEFALVHQLTETEANEIMVILVSKGIEASKIEEPNRVITYKIIVSESDQEEALQVLVANKLPKAKSVGLKEVYPAGSGGMIPSQSEEKARFLMAIQGEIEIKLKTFPNVVRAHVSIVAPEKDIVRDVDTAAPQPSASVAVIFNPNKSGDSGLTEEDIKNLVSASIEGLTPERVRVVLAANRPLSLVSGEQEQGLTGSVATVLGIDVATQKSGSKVKIFFSLFTILTLMGLGLGVFGLMRSIKMRSDLMRLQNELDAVEKSRE